MITGIRQQALGNSEKLKLVAYVLCAMLFALCSAAPAQQPKKVPRIAYLAASPASANAGRLEAFRQGLREMGYVEGENIVIEDRYAEGKFDCLPALAAELVRLNVDVIVTGGQGSTRPANEATSTIPIVMAQDRIPSATALSQPGGNITGLSNLSPELSGKRLELLKEIVPKLSSVAVLGTSTSPANAQSLRETEIAAGALAVKLQYLDVRGPKILRVHFELQANRVLRRS